MFVQRPNVEEDEDDLLCQQNKFLNKNDETIIKEESPIVAAISQTIIHDNHDSINYESKIIERDIVINKEDSLQPQSDNDNFTGFPIAEKLQVPFKSGCSLYAQKYLKANASKIVEKTDSTFSIITGAGLGCENWQQEMDKIKTENQKLIESMDKEKIEQLRQTIFKSLTPKTVAFLKSKQFPYRNEEIKSKTDVEMSFKVNDDKKKEVESKIPLSIQEIKSKDYLHMEVVEHEKLNWIGDISKTIANANNLSNDLSARFDFEGELIDETKGNDIDVHYGLHHHGEEQDRPGYNINELFLYLQSSYPSQKQLALKTLQRIITKAYSGYYDSMFNKNLVEYLLKDTVLVLVVRTCLDDNNPSVWKSALHTLKIILCNIIYDELFLDRGFLLFEHFFQNLFRSHLSLSPLLDPEIDFNETITDEQWALYDIIDCLLQRTSILQRLAYLMTNSVGDSSLLEDVLDILIRIARHSTRACSFIFGSSQMLKVLPSIMFTNETNLNDYTIVHAKLFKLFRICLSSFKGSNQSMSLRRLLDLFSNYSLIDALKKCLLLDPTNLESDAKKTIIMKIIIESQRLWLCLLNFVEVNHRLINSLHLTFVEIFPVILKQLQYCRLLDVDSNLFDYQYASYIITLIQRNLKQLQCDEELIKTLYDLIYSIANKFITIFHNQNEIPNFDLSLCFLTMINFIFQFDYSKIDFIKLIFDKLLNENVQFVQKLFHQCLENSNFNVQRRMINDKCGDSSNLPSFGSIYYFKNFNYIPFFNRESPILFLHALIRLLDNVNLASINIKMELIQNLNSYINQIITIMSNPFNSTCIFDLFEINLATDICLFFHKLIKDGYLEATELIVSTMLSLALLIYKVNIKPLKESMIENILFSYHLYHSFDSTIDQTRFKDYQSVYRKYSNLNTKYWIFDPIVKKAKTNDEMIQLNEVIASLEFIELIIKHFKYLLIKMELTNDAIFVSISSIFLINEDYFFNKDVETLLKRLLNKLRPMKFSKTTTISNDKGINNFFIEFLAQFDYCSYGNEMFTEYLLTFLQSSSDIDFRNLFFSEYSHLTTIIKLKTGQSI